MAVSLLARLDSSNRFQIKTHLLARAVALQLALTGQETLSGCLITREQLQYCGSGGVEFSRVYFRKRTRIGLGRAWNNAVVGRALKGLTLVRFRDVLRLE